MNKLFLLLLSGLAAFAADYPFKVEVSGKGQPMLLIPGLTSSADVWKETVAHFAARYECHAVTLGGFAGVPRAEGDFVATMREGLMRYMRDQKMKKPVIVGHSLGGFLALNIAATDPSLPGPLIIVDSLPSFGTVMSEVPLEQRKAQANGMRSQIAGGTQEAFEAYTRSGVSVRPMMRDEKRIQQVIEWGVKSNRQTVGDAMYELMVQDIRQDLARITSPALVIGTWIAFKDYSTRDEVKGRFEAQYAKLANKQFILHDTARHFVMFDDEAGFLKMLGDFLATAKRGR
jgi:N-formylmaleamate deformylase